MTDDQFNDWLNWHYAAFPVVEQQLLKLSDDSARNILRRWKSGLEGFGWERLERATEEMTRNRFSELSLTAHLAELRRLCNRYGAEARQEDRLPSLSEATPEQRAAASENLKLPMRVLAASARMAGERAAAGFFRQPIKFRKYWGGRIHDAIRMVSKLMPDEQYADTILSETRIVHDSCMKELRNANTLRSSSTNEPSGRGGQNRSASSDGGVDTALPSVDRAGGKTPRSDGGEGVRLPSGQAQQRKSYAVPAMSVAEAEKLAADAAAVEGDDCPF